MSNSPTTEMIVRPATQLTAPETRYTGLSMAFAPAEALKRLQELQAFVQQVMVRDVDFGVIPGTDKPTLLQPGAQKLAEVYGLAWRFEDDGSIQDWDRGFFNFRKRCVLTSRANGDVVGESMGSCNSREAKYAGRWVPADEVPEWHDKSKLHHKPGMDWKFENQLPTNIDRATLRTKTVKAKRDGREITMYGVPSDVYQVPNDDIASLVNTIEKMACKRAFVGAVVAATRSGNIFAHDFEELPEDVYGKADDSRTWEVDDSANAVETVTKQINAAPDIATLEAIGKTIGALDIDGKARKELRALYDRKRKSLPKPPSAELTKALAEIAALTNKAAVEAYRTREHSPLDGLSDAERGQAEEALDKRAKALAVSL